MEIKIRDNDNLSTIDLKEEDFTEFIRRDQEERSAAAGYPVPARTPQEIMDELNREEYNNWHRHNWQDRRASNSSLEAFNEHGNQLEISTMSAEKQFLIAASHAAVIKAWAALPERQKTAFDMTLFQGLSVTETVKRMGVTKGAISQLVDKASKKKISDELSVLGLNI